MLHIGLHCTHKVMMNCIETWGVFGLRKYPALGEKSDILKYSTLDIYIGKLSCVMPKAALASVNTTQGK